jgi:hypothetical protein
MSPENFQRGKRMEYLQRILNKYLTTEPKLSLEDLAEVISFEVGDLEKFLKVYITKNKEQ